MGRIKTSTGRVIVMSLVFATGLASFITLFVVYPNANVAPENISKSTSILLQIYLPLIGIMSAFYFSQAAHPPETSTSLEIFVFAFLVTLIWVALPIPLILYASVDDFHGFWSDFAAYGETVAVAAITYYFAKSGGEMTATRIS